MTPLLCMLGLAVGAEVDPTDAIFKDKGPVPVLKITVDPENLKKLQQDPRKYVKCQVKIGDLTLKDVGVHLKGAAGSYRDWNDKPGLTLNCDKFTPKQTYKGLDKFNLNNGAQDGTYLQELLANEIAMAAGIPGCRCTHALAELNGRKVGMYVLKEGFDKSWLRRHFENPNGNLYDGGFLTDINGALKLDTGVDNQRKDLQAVVKACSEGDHNKKYAAVEKLVDVDRFLTFSALQMITADWDGYIRKPNNYRIYFDPKSGKAVFIPHGMDQMWQNPGEPLLPGWQGMVARVILDHPEGKKKLLARLKEMTEKYFTLEKMTRRIDELAPRIHNGIEKAYGKGSAGGFDNEVRGLKERLKQRTEYIKRELPKLK